MNMPMKMPIMSGMNHDAAVIDVVLTIPDARACVSIIASLWTVSLFVFADSAF